MKYYQADKKLIHYNPESEVYKIRNVINEQANKFLSLEEFKKLKSKEIKKDEFSRLMNIFYKSVKEEWIHNYTRYKNLDNYETDKDGCCTNYDFNKLPKHNPEGSFYKNLILVYHWGKIYYFNWSYGGYPQGQLMEPNTLEWVRWAKPKHCSPIFNIDKHLIV